MLGPYSVCAARFLFFFFFSLLLSVSLPILIPLLPFSPKCYLFLPILYFELAIFLVVYIRDCDLEDIGIGIMDLHRIANGRLVSNQCCAPQRIFCS